MNIVLRIIRNLLLNDLSRSYIERFVLYNLYDYYTTSLTV